ncbi:MAG TPA: hypothetical protein VM580_31355 [Labilithrix sp.]|jgi:hypothetical protein|nr:hypothetical protein [Labilithrix sp.]
MNERVRVGEHEVWYEPDSGLVHEVLNGPLSMPDMLALSEWATKWANDANPHAAFYLIDIRNTTVMSARLRTEFRRNISKMPRVANGKSYVATFGGTFPARVTASMVFKGVELATKRVFARALVDEAEARTWLAQRMRAELDERH